MIANYLKLYMLCLIMVSEWFYYYTTSSLFTYKSLKHQICTLNKLPECVFMSPEQVVHTCKCTFTCKLIEYILRLVMKIIIQVQWIIVIKYVRNIARINHEEKCHFVLIIT